MRTIFRYAAASTLLAGISLAFTVSSPNLTSTQPTTPGNSSEIELTTTSGVGPEGSSGSDEARLKAMRASCLLQANVSESMDFTCNRILLVHYSLMEFWTHHGSGEMCQREADYKAAMECVLEASKSCLPPENALHFPDIETARAGLQYICGVHQQFDVDKSCARKHFPEVFDCVRRDTLLVVGGSYLQIPIQPHLICRTYDIADLCCWEKLQVCGSTTAAAYTRVMSLYLRPPSCRSRAAMSAPVPAVTVVVSLIISVLFART
ncbi:uncharacterized protein LOC112575209 [Pomacea canaliculata]|uniref:uncharacterized protein LOC112575209 n=1 Tax=Pomacea canaliculata TaxID=400727 RepID=UPI000D73D2D1|nr:uncharacterized protein LOC112575209 [Pomacea canaliculata]